MGNVLQLRDITSLDDLVAVISHKKLKCVCVLLGPEQLPGFHNFIAEVEFVIRFRDKKRGNYFVATTPFAGRNWAILCMSSEALDYAAQIAKDCGVWIEEAPNLAFVAGKSVDLPLGGEGVFLLNSEPVNLIVKDLQAEASRIKKILERLVAYT
jgi:hypothetical protein